MSTESRVLPFQPTTMSPAQLAAVSFLARNAGHTHELYTHQPRTPCIIVLIEEAISPASPRLRMYSSTWFQWCESNDLDARRIESP